MAHLRVTAKNGYQHYWNRAGAHTDYPPGFEGTVKAEVLAGAIKARAGESMDTPKPPEPQSEDA